MARLVEILAKELEEWPERGGEFSCDPDGEIRHSSVTSFDFYPKASVDAEDRAEDYGGMESVCVNESQWQAERDRQNGGEWKRHRGGKQPVDAGQRVEYKLRNGDQDECLAGHLMWDHQKDESDVMQYRIISQPQAEEVEVKAFVGKDVKLEYAFGSSDADPKDLDWKVIGSARMDDIASSLKTGQIEGPLAWRDTIIHCQAIIEDCEREIRRNVDLLDAEGLYMQLNAKVGMAYGEPTAIPLAEWKVGDIVEVISVDTFCDPKCKIGDQLPIIAVDDRDDTVKVVAGAWGDEDNYRFIRRP